MSLPADRPPLAPAPWQISDLGSADTTASEVDTAGQIRITGVRTILTAPENTTLVVVRIDTSEPGLYGLGCATFTQRARAVAEAVDSFLAPQLIGRDPADITDIASSLLVSSYWRYGPVLNNALSGVDMALWDLKGKQAGLPVWQLLGGRCRTAVPVYAHASGRDANEVEDAVRAYVEAGYRYVRCQVGVPGALTYGAPTARAGGRGERRCAYPPPEPYPERLGAGRLQPRRTCAVRPPSGPARLRPAPAARRTRTPAPCPGRPAGQGTRAVPAVLPGGPARARGSRLAPDDSGPDRDAARDR